jgi:predicted DNA-binding transcriptional regulator AlpA
MSDQQHAPTAYQQAPVGLTVLLDPPTMNLLMERLRAVIRQALAEELPKVRIGQHDGKAAPSVPELITAAAASGVDLSQQAKAKAAELRGSILPAKAQADDGGLIDLKTLARLMNVAQRTVYAFLSERAIPKPIHISGRLTRWRADEIRSWIESGCPPQDEWEQMRERRFSDWPLPRKKSTAR